MPTAGELKQAKRWLAQSAERDRARAQARRVREALKAVRERKREALASARAQCKRAKLRTRARVKAYRARERARVNQEAKRMRQETANRCKARIVTIRASSAKQAEKQRQIRAERAQEKRELAAVKERERIDRARITAAERAAESDDAVRANLEPHMIPIFNRVRKTIKGIPGKKTRTEAFLEWAEESPEVVAELAIERAERETKQLVAEQRKADRERARVERKKKILATKAARDAAKAAAAQQRARRLADKERIEREAAAIAREIESARFGDELAAKQSGQRPHVFTAIAKAKVPSVARALARGQMVPVPVELEFRAHQDPRDYPLTLRAIKRAHASAVPF